MSGLIGSECRLQAAGAFEGASRIEGRRESQDNSDIWVDLVTPTSPYFEKLPRERPPSAVREPDSAFASDQPAAAGGGGPADPRLDVGRCVCGRAAQRPAQGPAFLLPLQRMISNSVPPSLFMHDFSVFRVRLGKRAARRTPQRQTVTECWYTSYNLLSLARGRRRLRITRVHCVPGLRLENLLPALRPRPPRQG